MTSEGLLIAVPADVQEFGHYTWHAAPSTYLSAIAASGAAVPVIVPALLPAIDVDVVLDRVDGVLLTGAASNVHPDRYGVPPSRAHEPFDPARDRLTDALVHRALDRELPLLAICRGHQELNVSLGGTLATEIQEIEGKMDHRASTHHDQRERYAIKHAVTPQPESRLARIVGTADFDVNSLHRQAIDRLSDRLVVEARAPDGTVEAVSVKDAKGFTLGVQWHPEYWVESDKPSAAIFEAFLGECRAYRDMRRKTFTQA